jgi:hypothetical protein
MRRGLQPSKSFNQSFSSGAAISGDLLSAVISTRYILGFRKDNPNVFNMLVQNLPHCQRHKMHMLLILLALCLRKSDGISHLFSIAYAFAGNGCLLASARAHHSEAVPIADLTAAELDAKITALAGSRGLSRLLKEALEEERTRR